MSIKGKVKTTAFENVIKSGENVKKFLGNCRKSLDNFLYIWYYKTYLDT